MRAERAGRDGTKRARDKRIKGLSSAGGAVAPPAIFLETLAKRILICYNGKGKRRICFYQP